MNEIININWKAIETKIQDNSSGSITQNNILEEADKITKLFEESYVESYSRGEMLREQFRSRYAVIALSSIPVVNTGFRLENGTLVVDLEFGGDLTRKSFARGSEGLKNIVALLNNGYRTKLEPESLWGVWHYQYTPALEWRMGSGFIQKAAEIFKIKAEKFGYKQVLVNISDEYSIIC